MIKITESDSHYDNLEKMSVSDILLSINNEDQKVAKIVANHISDIEIIINVISSKIHNNGRLFYIGAGTSGRLGIVDASECPPTFGVEPGIVNGLIAGGDQAIRKAVEFAEDNDMLGWKELQNHQININDIVIGIAASGTTPYVVGALNMCQKNNITTGCIVCNQNSPLAKHADFPIEVVVGPEFITGSTRMKAGTAQKLILNMISTAVMINLGKVKGNKMVDMQLSNNKLIDRGVAMLMKELNIDVNTAKLLLEKHGSVRNAITNYG